MDYIEDDLFNILVTGNVTRLVEFLDKRLDVNHVFRCTDYPDRLGKSMADIAIASHQYQVVKTLIERGSTTRNTYIVDICEFAYTIKSYTKQNRLKLTPMYRCIVENDLEMIKYLVRGGFDVNVYDDRGCSALWHAVDLDDYEMVKTMLSAKGCDVNFADRAKLTPLHVAAIHGNAKIMSRLLRQGAKVDAIQLRGSTPLCLASRSGNYDTVRFLLLNGADPNHVGYNGHTPLSSALPELSDMRLVQLLVDAGALGTFEMIKKCKEEKIKAFKRFPQLLGFLRQLSSNPQSLRMSCSLEIRKRLMNSPTKLDLLRKSYLVPLPKLLREYVVLNHLCKTV